MKWLEKYPQSHSLEICNNNKQTINKLNLKQNQVNKTKRIKLNYNQTKLKLKSNYNIKKEKIN